MIDLDRFATLHLYLARIAAGLHIANLLAIQNHYAFFAEIVIQVLNQADRKNIGADTLAGEDHGDFLLVYGEPCGQFGADETATDDSELAAFVRLFAESLVIRHGAVIADQAFA